MISAAGGIAAVLVAVLISWAVLSEASPIYQGPYNQGPLEKIWMLVNIIPIMAGFVAGGHSGSTPVLVIGGGLQWFLVGFIITYIVQAFRGRNS